MRTRLLLSSLALGFLLGPAGASALDRPAVQVRFSLAEPVYLDEFTAAERQTLERDLTRFLVQRLSDEIGFLRFSAVGPADFTLAFRLGDPGASRTSFHEVGFLIRLTGPEDLDATAFWPFRGRNAWGTSTGSLARFQTEIRGQLSRRPPGELVPGVLSFIPVAQAGDLFLSPTVGVAWILPFRQSELCLDVKSQLRLEAKVEDSALGTFSGPFLVEAMMPFNPPGQTPREELRHRLLCIALPKDQTGLELVRQSTPDKVKIERIFVTSYRKISSGCGGPLAPAAAAATFGGGQ